MTTTVRSVRVEMDLGVARYVANARLVGRETDAMGDRIERRLGGLNRSLGDTDTTLRKVSGAEDAVTASTARMGTRLDQGGRSIDKFSGRLRTALDLVQVLGPAALRLGLGSLPAVSAGLAGVGAGAGGIVVTALAVSGLGDAFKALNDYELERTPENLQEVRLQLQKLGPDGAHFIRYIRDLQPGLRRLQLLARAGVLPGFEDGIDHLLDRLPMVEKIVNRLSREVGDLADDAGESLASDEWTPFFAYMRDQGAPILDDVARSAGNVALGLANILVAMDPLTQDALGGLADGTERFADATGRLDENERFQAFLAEAREAGPEVVDFLGSAMDLMVGLARASAPVGEIMLPVLTSTADVLAAIANSPAGPALYTAAAGLVAFNRASTIAEKSSTRLRDTWADLGSRRIATGVLGGVGLMATSLTDLDERMGLTHTTMYGLAGLMIGGPWGAAIGGGIGLVQDFTSAQGEYNDELERTYDIAQSGTLKEQQAEYERLAQHIDDTKNAQRDFFDDGRLKPSLDAVKGWLFGTDRMEDALDTVGDSMSNTGGLADIFGRDIGQTGDQLRLAAGDAEAFSGALAELSGWFDKRAAVRGYRDAVAELRKELRDGFGREDVEMLDDVGRSILQVAEQIKDPGTRGDFLAGARASLLDMAENAGPRAEAAIKRVIAQFDAQGLTHAKFEPEITPKLNDGPAKGKIADIQGLLDRMSRQRAEPTADLNDNPFYQQYDLVTGGLTSLDRKTAEPKVSVDAGNSLGIVGQLQRMLSAVDGTHATSTVTVTRINKVQNQLGGSPGGIADGGTVPGQRHPYGDKVLAALAPGEEVISNRHGQADRFRADRAAGRIPGYADGGYVRDTYTSRAAALPSAMWGPPGLAAAGDGASRSLKQLEKAADKVRSSYEKEKSQLEALISQRDSAAASIASSYTRDALGNGLAGFDAQIAADRGDIAAMAQALATLVRNGLDPKSALYQELASDPKNLATAQQLAALSAGELTAKSQAYEARAEEASALGGTVAGQALDDTIRDSAKATRELRTEMRRLNDRIEDLRNIRKDVRDGAAEGSEWGSARGTERGARGARDERNRRVAAMSRAGGGGW